MGAAEIAVFIAGASFALTVIVLLVRGSYLLGKLINKVDNQEAGIATLNGKVDNQAADNQAAGIAILGEKVDNQAAGIATLNGKVDTLTAALNELHAELQQTNRILVGLANHTHDADGRTVFTIPS
jgi:outer membrane murein-binding lipoprotein Lpp